MNTLLIPVSAGELLDKVTILEIKSERIADAAKRANVMREFALLSERWSEAVQTTPRLASLKASLKAINEQLWDIEDSIRDCESRRDFGAEFVDLARSVYITNDERARLKREVNTLLGSDLVEEKSYSSYR